MSDDLLTDPLEETEKTKKSTKANAASAGSGDDDQKFLEYIVKQIVENPSDVVIERTVDEMGVLLSLKVHKDDMGKLIGKNGQTAKSIRTLLRIIGSKNNARVNLKIVEPEVVA